MFGEGNENFIYFMSDQASNISIILIYLKLISIEQHFYKIAANHLLSIGTVIFYCCLFLALQPSMMSFHIMDTCVVNCQL